MTAVPLRSLLPSRLAWARLADVVIAVCLTIALVVMRTGGFTIDAGGVDFAAHDPWRALAIAVGVLLVRLIATRRLLWLAHLLAVALLLQGVLAQYERGAGFISLIAFGDEFRPRALPAMRAVVPHADPGSGYDGQFYAQVALDPLLRDPAIAGALDSPGYRARRVLFAWSAWLLGLGQPYWVLQAYAIQNVLCWFILAWLLTRWFPVGTWRGFALWFGCLFTDGLVTSVGLALVDGPSLLLIVLVVLAMERNRPWVAAGMLGLAGLGRDTSLLAGTALLQPGWWKPDRLRAIVLQGLVALLPLVLWLVYVRWVAGLDMSWGGSNFAAPFTGYVMKWRVTIGELLADGFESFSRFSLYGLLSVTVQMGYLAARRDWQSAWWRVGVAHAFLLVMLGWAVWEGYPGAFTRTTMPLTVAFNVQIRGERWFWPLAVLGNLTVLHGLEILRVPWISLHL